MSEAVIKDGFIVIKVPLDVLDKEYVIPDELMNDQCKPLVKVTNVKKFAKYFLNALNHEAEDGSTMITDILDKAFLNAVEDGAEGVEDITYPEDNQGKVMNEYMILVKPWAVYVKELDFFKAQNGHLEDWGKDWQPVLADSIEQARERGKFLQLQIKKGY